MIEHLGIHNDQLRADEIAPYDRCGCCEGTGNMLLFMYFKCIACNGDGKRRSKAIEEDADAEFSRRMAPSGNKIREA